jgi:hypothetical protein
MANIKINDQALAGSSIKRLVTDDPNGASLAPLTDHIVVESGGDFYDIELPGETQQGPNPGDSLKITSETFGTFTGTVRYFADCPMAPGASAMHTVVTIAGQSFEADIEAVDTGTEANAVPFKDELLVSYAGKRYRVLLPPEAEIDKSVKTGETIYIYYKTSAQQEIRFMPKVEAIGIEHERKDQYELTGITTEISYIPGNPEAVPDFTASKAVQDEFALAELRIKRELKERSPFKAGHTYSATEVQAKVKTLAKRLSEYCFNVGIEPEWDQAGHSIKLKIVAIPPVHGVIRGAMASGEWAPKELEDDVAMLTAAAKLLVKGPLSVDGFKAADKQLREIAKSRFVGWQYNGLKILGLKPDGTLDLALDVDAKAVSLNLKVKEAGGNVETFSETEMSVGKERGLFGKLKKQDDDGNPDGGFWNPADQSQAKDAAWASLSEHYAKDDQILVLKKDGVTMPFVTYRDDIVLDRHELKFNPEVGDVTVTQPPTDIVVEGIPGLKDDKVERIFREGAGKAGAITSKSITEGMYALYAYLNLKGLMLVKEDPNSQTPGKLDYEIVGNQLKIKAKVYELAEPVEPADFEFPAGTPADQKTKSLKWLKHEAVFNKVGEPLDMNDISMARLAIAAYTRFEVSDVRFEPQSGHPEKVALKFILKPKPTLGGADVTAGMMTDADGVTPILQGIETLNPGGVAMTGKQTVGFGTDFDSESYSILDSASLEATLSLPAHNQARDRVVLFGGGSWDIDGDASNSATLGADYVHPLTPYSNWSVFGGLGVQGVWGYEGDGNGLYLKPRVGLRYSNDKEKLTAEVFIGPRVYLGEGGGVFWEAGTSVHKRWDITKDHKLYAEAYAKAGILFGAKIPSAAMYQSLPISMNGTLYQSPVQLYVGAGAALMYEAIPSHILGGFDLGIGTNVGAIPGLFTAGVGIKVKSRLLGMTVLIGPAIVNGVPTPISVSLGNQ